MLVLTLSLVRQYLVLYLYRGICNKRVIKEGSSLYLIKISLRLAFSRGLKLGLFIFLRREVLGAFRAFIGGVLVLVLLVGSF
jgi:hypothetical protein